MCVCSLPLGGDVLTDKQYTAPLLQSGLHVEFKRLSKFQLDSREDCILLAVFYIMITMRSCVETLLTLWLCFKKDFIFPENTS